MRLKLCAYEPGDINRFTLRADMADEHRVLRHQWGPDGMPPGRAFTLTEFGSGKILGIGGVIDQGDGLWTAWSQLSDLPRRAWPRAIILADQVLTGLMMFNGAKAIEASSRTLNPAARAVLERLGFVYTETAREPRLGDALYDIMHRVA